MELTGESYVGMKLTGENYVDIKLTGKSYVYMLNSKFLTTVANYQVVDET